MSKEEHPEKSMGETSENDESKQIDQKTTYVTLMETNGRSTKVGTFLLNIRAMNRL